MKVSSNYFEVALCSSVEKNNFVREQAKSHHILSSCSTIEIAICMKGSNWVGDN